MSNNASIVTQTNIVLIIDGVPTNVPSTHPNFQNIKELLGSVEGIDWDTVQEQSDIPSAIVKHSEGMVTVEDGEVFYQGTRIAGVIAERILDMVGENESIKILSAFIENLMLNPSNNSVRELYGFLEASSMPITEDGCFVAYKRVNGNYRDCFSNSIDNSIGAVVSMPRNQVNDDKNRTCSNGLHVCSHSYLRSFGGARTILCKINPKDVVSVPTDYNNAKMRVCEYTVIGELESDRDDVLTEKSVFRNAMTGRVEHINVTDSGILDASVGDTLTDEDGIKYSIREVIEKDEYDSFDEETYYKIRADHKASIYVDADGDECDELGNWLRRSNLSIVKHVRYSKISK